ncbi:unnamed protein product (macronuclear) [Paramecium tetraurelia]|uniref:Uncharacterized protein n=1 Tax=Paramecium tetraurelia TaxID=5888 RepID=A0DQ42_PARTE|nr:uncharacterized protein GSPATT00002559001 [Paramecium tetraurelia]CAK85159.1 unnamed protein product [Paramecium tetraurelia]|eukprot:XP_001452556.1 hypothetical protein (macronuclear) [Paramecium tetraurelia strain d4-2]
MENQQLSIENSRLKERLLNVDIPDKGFSNKFFDDHEIKDKEFIIQKLEQEIIDKDNQILKFKREIESINRRSKLKEEELHRQYQAKLEDLQILYKNDSSDNQQEKFQLTKKLADMEQIVTYRTEENQLLINELNLKNEQIVELNNHNKLLVELKNKEFKDSQINYQISIQQQLKQMEEALAQYKRSQESNLSEIEQLLQFKQSMTLKINDLSSTNQHLIIENESLKSTLLLFQKQKDQDDYMYEDQKKKETLHIKRYYETLLEQVEKENRSLRLLLEQKSRELDDLCKRY